MSSSPPSSGDQLITTPAGDEKIRTYLPLDSSPPKSKGRFGNWGEASYPAELDQWAAITSSAGIIGFVCGAVLGVKTGKQEALSYLSAHGRQLPLQEQQRILYKGMAQGSSRKAVFWAVNFGVFVGLYSGIQKYLQVKREKNDFLNSVAGGAAAGSIFSLRHGLTAIPRGTALGAGLGLAAGLISDVTNLMFPKEFVLPPRIPVSPVEPMTETDLIEVGNSLGDSLREHEEFELWASRIERRALLDTPVSEYQNLNQNQVTAGHSTAHVDFVDRKQKR